MRILITGAAGMLGRDVVAAATAAGHDVTALTRAELDITDADAVRRTIIDRRPNAVINCAAWTDVDGAESAEEEALAINGRGAGLLARAAQDAGAHVVHVSTDYVFAGDASEPYTESAPVAERPATAYGRTKLAGEQAVREGNARSAVVRTAWVFGPGGRNFVDTMRRLAGERDALSVVDDQRGCPTYTGHLADALVTVAERQLTGTLHLAGAGACTWFDLARATFEATGAEVELSPTDSATFAAPAPRPAFSVLASERDDAPRLPDWRAGLAAHLDASQEVVT